MTHNEITQYSKSKKRGCPTCDGVYARSCMRCHGRTKMCEWWHTSMGWAHASELTPEELMAAGLIKQEHMQ